MFTIASALLEANKNFCIEEVMSFISVSITNNTSGFEGFPQTLTSMDFCRRDTTFVLNAYITDLASGNSDRLEFVASRYWKGYESSLVGDRQKEVAAHTFLKELINNYILAQVPFPTTQSDVQQTLGTDVPEAGATGFIEKEVGTLIDVILNGPKKLYLHNRLERRMTTRFWDQTRPLESEYVETILECAYQAPSKNGKHEFEIVVLTDSEAGQEFKRWLYRDNTYCLDKVRAKPGPGMRRFNGQVTAPIVMIWLAKDYPGSARDIYGEDNDLRNDRDCLVSATMAMCQAEDLGVNTGFCGCLGAKDVAIRLGKPDLRAVVAIGFGYMDRFDSAPMRQVFRQEDGVLVGFDISNTHPSIRTYENRNRRPAKYSMINYI